MKPVPFVGCNVVLVAPGCEDLPALKTDTQIVTTWQMSQDDVAKLLNGGHVRLAILTSGTQPPVALWVE